MSLLTQINEATPGNFYFVGAGDLPNTQSGIASGLTWTATGLNSTYLATILVPAVSATSVIQATVAETPEGGDFSDAVNCWLVSCYGGAGAINFIVAGQPTAPARFKIAWQVIKY